MDIKVEYSGAYPNLCSGKLVITIDGTCWEFPDYCLSSGGSVSFNEGGEVVTHGEWSIYDWPEGFPENLKTIAKDAVNSSVSFGCCGGCV